MGVGKGNDKRSSQEPDDRKPDGKQIPSARPQLPSWRPGRSPANSEWNLAIARQLRTNPRRTRRTLDKSSDGTEQPESKKRRIDEAGESSSERSSATQLASPSPQKWTRRPIPPDWKPPLAVGASLGENLSRFEEAERLVLQWEAIIENARKTQPTSDLSSFERQLEQAKQERDQMEEIEENMVPINELASTKRDRIQERLKILQEALERTESPKGLANIRTAIDAYEDGRIQCWDKWTLIYAGHIVDFCPYYESFTQDRRDRLDRYFEQHGDGWLWFEPPLAPKGNPQPEHLFAATWAQPSVGGRSEVFGGETGWDITMGFRRVLTFHSRTTTGYKTQVMNRSPSSFASFWTQKSEAESEIQGRTRSTGKYLTYLPTNTGMSKEEMGEQKWSVNDDADGPRCFFLMHLDSGASMPCLYDSDLRVLGINPHEYPPQTYTRLSTANGHVLCPLYEMRVDICRHNGESLVGENPVWPRERHEIGGIFPVAIFLPPEIPPKGTSGPLTIDALQARQKLGYDVSEEALAGRRKKHNEMRLSGLLPFQVCYSACAPGMKLWFGEDRRDVLGIDKMPGQRRFERHKSLKVPPAPAHPDLKDFPNTVAFEHQLSPSKWIIDRDVMGCVGASITTVVNGTEVKNHRLEPRRLPSQQPKKAQDEAKAEKNRNFLGLFGQLVAKRK